MEETKYRVGLVDPVRQAKCGRIADCPYHGGDIRALWRGWYSVLAIIPRRPGIEAQHYLDGLFLKHTERTLGVALQIEGRVVPLERHACQPGLAYVRETPQPRLFGPVGPPHQEYAIPVEQAEGPNLLSAPLSRRLGERFGLSWWDSAILAAARMCGCDAVYTEDPSDEQDYDGLRVVNPFTHSPNRT